MFHLQLFHEYQSTKSSKKNIFFFFHGPTFGFNNASNPALFSLEPELKQELSTKQNQSKPNEPKNCTALRRFS